MLGGLTIEEFLRDYWQKKPLLIRQAFSQFNGLLDQLQLFALACAEDVQSRLVTQRHGQWQVQDFSPVPETQPLPGQVALIAV